MFKRSQMIPMLAILLLSTCTCSGGQKAADSGGSTLPDSARLEAGAPKDEAGAALNKEAGPLNPHGKTYFVRPKGGSAAQCTGLADKDYPGSGDDQDCAFSHPFLALPPSGTPRLVGGDWLIIAPGAYRMGVGAPGAVGCSTSYSYDCDMQPVPSGPSKDRPTRILGGGFASGCKQKTELYGVERAWRVIDLTNSSNVELDCLEITDHSSCVESHSGSLACARSGNGPYGEWSPTGIYAANSSNVTLRRLDIHGLAHHGIHAGKLTDWTLLDVRIAGNGWIGFDGDLGSHMGSSANTGTMTFRRVTVAYNGCGETYPGGKPAGCWGQSAGGYGDGIGTASTGGDWIFEDCKFLHNTSDGLDLLYHELGGKVVVRRCHAEGNAGNQIKVSGADLTLENNVMVGNCAYFKDKAFTHNVDHCRALGNTLSIGLRTGAKVHIVNNTLFGEGDVLLTAEPRQCTCDGSERLVVRNNIFVGSTDFHQPTEKTALAWAGNCSGLSLDADYNVVHNVKGSCTLGSNDRCSDPRLGPLSGAGDASRLKPRADSPAIDNGVKIGGVVPDHDIDKRPRPQGKGVDIGAHEVM